MDTSSEDWRFECEAREVASWPKEKRDAFYPEVAKKRGKLAAKALVNAVSAAWKEKNERDPDD